MNLMCAPESNMLQKASATFQLLRSFLKCEKCLPENVRKLPARKAKQLLFY